ncbi:MAG TPA: hypothetical protein VGE24_17655 [Emticicia sp.]
MKNKYLLLLLSLTSCEFSDTQSFNISTKADTSINIKRKIPHQNQMVVIVKGELEDDCTIMLKEGKLPDNQVVKRTYTLEKGIVNDTLGSSDIYADWGDIVFKHQNNTKGHLNIEVKF